MKASVHFTDTPANRLPARELDAELRRPLLDRASYRTPTARLLAALTKGLALSASPTEVRYAARRLIGTTDPALSRVLNSDRSWSALSLQAREFVAGPAASESGVSQAQLAVARRLVGHIFSPAPRAGGMAAVGSRSMVSARAALAVIAAQSLTDGRDFDSSIASMTWLATHMNLTDGNARQATRNLEKLGWVSRLNATSQGAARWRLRPLNKEADAIAWDHAETATAIASGTYDDDPLAAVLLSILHPAWAYSEGLGLGAWLATAAGLAAVPAETLGLGKDRARVHRKTVGALLPELTTAPLTPQLDALAEDTLAIFIKGDRELAHAELVQERQAERDAFAERRKAERVDERYVEREIIRPAMRELRGFPGEGWTREEVNKWMSADRERGWVGAFAYFRKGAGQIHDVSLVPVVRKKLRWLMEHGGLDAATAGWVVDQLTPAIEEQ